MNIEFAQRTDTYMTEPRYEKPKQVFCALADLMRETGLAHSDSTHLDIGCATGELIYYLRKQFPKFQFTGVDNKAELLAEARRQSALRKVTFVEADALKYRGVPQDFVTCFGMLGIFDDFEPILESLIANTRSGGYVYIHGLINDVDIDVRVYYKDHHNQKDWNRGFNIFSRARLEEWLKPRVRQARFLPFALESELPRNESAPHRAYTTRLADGRLVTTNGLCLMLPEKIVEIAV